MEQIKDGGPAFPTNGPDHGVYGAGISLRDYFAATALPAVIRSMAQFDQQKLIRLHGMEMAQIYARVSYEIAGAMLEARKS